MSDALATQDDQEKALRASVQRIAAKAAATIEGLYEEATLPDGKANPRYNADANATWADCTMKTRAALVIHKAAGERQGDDVGRAFGVIILTARSASAAAWEEKAREVDQAERQRAAIDVSATVVKP